MVVVAESTCDKQFAIPGARLHGFAFASFTMMLTNVLVFPIILASPNKLF